MREKNESNTGFSANEKSRIDQASELAALIGGIIVYRKGLRIIKVKKNKNFLNFNHKYVAHVYTTDSRKEKKIKLKDSNADLGSLK